MCTVFAVASHQSLMQSKFVGWVCWGRVQFSQDRIWFQTVWAKGQSMQRCWLVSIGPLQRAHEAWCGHPRRARLSAVRIFVLDDNPSKYFTLVFSPRTSDNVRVEAPKGSDELSPICWPCRIVPSSVHFQVMESSISEFRNTPWIRIHNETNSSSWVVFVILFCSALIQELFTCLPPFLCPLKPTYKPL